MKKRRPLRQAFGVGLLLLSGCSVAQNARSDFGKATHAIASATQSSSSSSSTSMRKADIRTAGKTSSAQDPSRPEISKPDPSRDVVAGMPVSLVGKSEGQIRALLGPPTSEEDRAPGKTWHYRDGQCTVDVQLYPDVQTRQFGTLAYEVKSDDSTDEGKRLCVAQLRSRTERGGG